MTRFSWRARVWIAVVGAGILLAAGCAGEQESAGVVARVGEVALDLQSVARELGVDTSDSLGRLALRRSVETWIETQLLAQEAMKRGLADDPAIARELQRVRDELLAQAALRQLLPDTFQISDDEVKRYYEANKEAFRRSEEEVRLQEVLVGQRSLATEIYQRARKGEDLGDLARRYSQGPWKDRGGDTGVIPMRSLPDPVRMGLRRAKAGQLLKPIHIEDGYLVVKVLRIYPADSVRELDEVRDRIVLELKRMKYREAYRQLIRDLSSRTEVWVNEMLLGESGS